MAAPSAWLTADAARRSGRRQAEPGLTWRHRLRLLPSRSSRLLTNTLAGTSPRLFAGVSLLLEHSYGFVELNLQRFNTHQTRLGSFPKPLGMELENQDPAQAYLASRSVMAPSTMQAPGVTLPLLP